MYLQRLSIIFSIVCFSLVSWGAGEGGAVPGAVYRDEMKSNLAECIKGKQSKAEIDSCYEIWDRGSSNSSNARCDSKYSDYSKAAKDFQSKCSGINNSDIKKCTETIERCGEESVTATNMQADAMNNPQLLSQLFMESSSSDFCPRKTSKDAKEDRESAAKLLKENQESIAKSKEKADEITANFQSKKADFEEQTIKLLNEIEQSDVNLDQSVRDTINRSRENSKRMADQIMSKHVEITNLKQKLLALEATKIAKLEAAADRCDDQLEAKKAELKEKINAAKKSKTYRVGSLNSLGGAKKYWESELTKVYEKCLNRAMKEKKLINADFQMQYADAKANLAKAENQRDQLDDEITKEKANLDLKINELERAGKANQAAMIKTLQLNNDRLADLADQATKAQDNITQQNNMAMMQMFMTGQAAIGAKTAYPDGIKNTVGDAAAEFEAFQSSLMTFAIGCCAGGGSGTSDHDACSNVLSKAESAGIVVPKKSRTTK